MLNDTRYAITTQINGPGVYKIPVPRCAQAIVEIVGASSLALTFGKILHEEPDGPTVNARSFLGTSGVIPPGNSITPAAGQGYMIDLAGVYHLVVTVTAGTGVLYTRFSDVLPTFASVDMINPGFPIAVSFTSTAAAHTTGQLLADATILTNASRIADVGGYVADFTLTDEDDQTTPVDIDVVFLRNSTSLGTLGATPNISDANDRGNVLGIVTCLAGSFRDLGAHKVSSQQNVNVRYLPASTTRNIYVGLITRGSLTPTAAGWTGLFKMMQD